MEYFSRIDYTLIGIYFLFLIGFAILLRKRASGSLEDYFLGGRKLPWWMLGFSGIASQVNITGTMIILSFLYMLGPRGIYIEFRGGVCLIMVFAMIWGGKWHRRSGCMTLGEWMMFRFGQGAGAKLARFVTVFATIVSTVSLLALMIKGLGIFLSMFLPYSPFVCCLIFIGIATFYTMLSGFYGVVFTDIFQSILIFIGAIVITVLAVNKIPDFQSLADVAARITGNKDWMSSIPHWRTTLLPGYEGYKYLFSFALFYLIHNTFFGISSGVDPKYFGARNDRECGLLTCFWLTLMTFRWPLMMAFAVLGIYLVNDSFAELPALAQAVDLIKQQIGYIPESRWPDVLAGIVGHPENYPTLAGGLEALLGQGWAGKLQMLSYHGNINPETIMPAVLLKSIPTGLRGMMLIALIAAAMSSFDSAVNAATAYFTRDVYQGYIRVKAKTTELIGVSYVFIILLVAGGFALAYTLKSVNDIWAWMVMGFTSGVIVPGLLRLLWWRFNAAGFAIGTFMGITFAILQRIFYPGIDERLQFVCILTFTLVFTIIATLLSKPTKLEVLENFYKKTRPFGFWRPLKRRLSPEVREKVETEHRNDIIAVPFVMGWQVSMFMMPMQLIIHSFGAFWVTFCIFIICLIGMYFFWYKKLPPAETSEVKQVT